MWGGASGGSSIYGGFYRKCEGHNNGSVGSPRISLFTDTKKKCAYPNKYYHNMGINNINIS
jgi:hypothetical protein